MSSSFVIKINAIKQLIVKENYGTSKIERTKIALYILKIQTDFSKYKVDVFIVLF